MLTEINSSMYTLLTVMESLKRHTNLSFFQVKMVTTSRLQPRTISSRGMFSTRRSTYSMQQQAGWFGGGGGKLTRTTAAGTEYRMMMEFSFKHVYKNLLTCSEKSQSLAITKIIGEETIRQQLTCVVTRAQLKGSMGALVNFKKHMNLHSKILPLEEKAEE